VLVIPRPRRPKHAEAKGREERARAVRHPPARITTTELQGTCII
jgi:hypothetical protein